MKYGVDFASEPKEENVIALKEAGKRFCCRYVSSDGNPKNVTLAEIALYKKHGLELVIVFETFANRALMGQQAGLVDAKSALAQLPPEMRDKVVIYFAVDFNTTTATSAQLRSIYQYFLGARAILTHNRLGGYGGYHIIKNLFDLKIIKYGWQTYAWSGGQWEPRAHLRQYLNNISVAGLSVDLDRSNAHDFGQWPRPLIKPPLTRAQIRAKLRAQIRKLRKLGIPWNKIKKLPIWKKFRVLGGK